MEMEELIEVRIECIQRGQCYKGCIGHNKAAQKDGGGPAPAIRQWKMMIMMMMMT